MKRYKEYNESVGNLSVKDLMTPKSREDIMSSFENGTPTYSALWYAINQKDMDMVKTIIDMGVDLNSETNSSIIESTVFDDNYELTKLLLDSGYKIIRKRDQHPLIYAINNRNIDMVKLLLKHGIYVSERDVKRAEEIGEMEIHKLLDRRYRGIVTRIRKMYDPFNESIRSEMKPKSEDEIKDIVKGKNMSVNNKVTFGLTNGFDWLVRQGLSELPSLSDNQLKLLSVRFETSQLYPQYVKDEMKKEMSKRGLTVDDRKWTPLDTIMVGEGVKDMMIGKPHGEVDIMFNKAAEDMISRIVKFYGVKRIEAEDFLNQHMKTFRWRLLHDGFSVNDIEDEWEYLLYNTFGKNESVKDFMSPKSEEDIKDLLDGLTSEELYRRLMDAISNYNEDMACIILPFIDIKKYNFSEQLALLEVTADVSCRETLKMMLEKGIKLDVLKEFLSYVKIQFEEPSELIHLVKGYIKDVSDEDESNEDKSKGHINKTNESVRDKMTRKPMEDIEDLLNSLTTEELNDRLVRSITKYDLETFETILPYVDLNYEGQELDLCELCIDLGHLKALDMLLDKGVSNKTKKYLLSHINGSEFDEIDRRIIGNMVKKERNKKNESFVSDQKMTSLSDSEIKGYREIGLKKFQSTFDGFNGLTRNEGVENRLTSVRDLMVGKSDKEISNIKNDIIQRINHIVEVNGGKLTMKQLETVETPIYKIEDVIYTIETLYVDEVEVESWENSDKTLRVKYTNLKPDILLDLKDMLEAGIKWRDLHEGVIDKMTPKSEEEIELGKKDIINYITHVVEVNGGYIDMLELTSEDSPIVYDVEGSNETDEEQHSDVIHKIITLYTDEVDVEIYDNWEEESIDVYRVKYENMSPEILLELKELLKNIDDELVN
jgi:hypothetical protein